MGLAFKSGFQFLALTVLSTGATFAPAVLAMASEPAPSAPPTSYGDIYWAEDRAVDTSSGRIGLRYQHELSNPYLNIDGLQLSAAKSLSRFVHVGGAITGYRSEETDLLRSLNSTLRSQNAGVQADKPTMSGYGTLTLVPFAGHLNFFGTRPVELELAATLGPGMVFYQDMSAFAVEWMIQPSARISARWSVELTIGQEIESPFGADQLNRLFGGVGLVYRL